MISIIIPTLNEAKIIESTLRTLAATLTLPHEVIVSDGGSSDRTAELAARYANTVVVYSGASRQTIGEGRNDGAKVAAGDFLVFLDADCVVPEPAATALISSAVTVMPSASRPEVEIAF